MRKAAGNARAKLAEYRRKRDFDRTAEPSGDAPAKPARTLRFVIQKHAATALHYDFRLELGGVMKSWAVPKGPSLDPAVKRLAMEVEDHPIAYNTFEGTIPKGQYGGGTVMLWDRGTYDSPTGGEDALRRGYESGRMDLVMHGERIQGAFSLIRTRGRGDKPQWLLMKRTDAHARPGSDVTGENETSIESARSMDEIARGKKGEGRGRAKPKVLAKVVAKAVAKATKKAAPSPALEPMYASIGTDVPKGDAWTFEPKYDGIRVLAFATPTGVRLVTRNGNDKSAGFPEVTAAIQALATRARRSLVLDGEVVALIDGKPARFQALQSRMHVKDGTAVLAHAESTPATLIAFDILVDGDDVLVAEPWTVRRKRLEKVLASPLRGAHAERVLLGDTMSGDGAALVTRAYADGWEGIIAKRKDARYEPGIRTKQWLKLKVEFRQEFVVGGFTEPRNTRKHLGALLLGYHDAKGDLVYVGHAGGGFTGGGLAEMAKRLKPLIRKTSPFAEKVRTNEPARWVRPEVVVEVKFNEWTDDGRLRQPIVLGVRDDKDAREVTRERTSVQEQVEEASVATKKAGAKQAATKRATKTATKSARKSAATKSSAKPEARKPVAKRSSGGGDVVAQLERIEAAGGSGTVTLPGGAALAVSNLDKVFFPEDGLTKGDVMRYYARMAKYVLPVVAERPLVMRRFPNGIGGKAFFHHNVPDAPAGVRTEAIDVDKDGEPKSYLVGGDLATTLYVVQLGALSMDPFHGTWDALDTVDYTILDLDPGDDATFERVIDVARWVKAELDALGLHAAVKTSGSSGIHIVVPLPKGTHHDAAVVLAELVATRVATKHPAEATVERKVRARATDAVYVDYLQNIPGKTVAGAYAVRAKPGATVSTPLSWDEVRPGLDLRAFTIETVPARVAKVGDLWATAMKKRNSAAALKKIGKG